jgi:hypothetical protein
LLCGCEIVEEKLNYICKEGNYYDVTFMRMTKEKWDLIRKDKKFDKIDFSCVK